MATIGRVRIGGDLAGSAFTRDEARTAGVSDAALGRAYRRGDLQRLARGVWADARLPADERLALAAATLRAPDAVASHATAARLWGVDTSDGRLHVTVAPRTSMRSGAGLAVHRDRLASGEVTVRQGAAVTGPYRTVLDVARSAPTVTAVIVADALLAAERVEREELLDRLARLGGRRGVARARRALELCRYGAQSPGETRLRLVLGAGGVPEPQLQQVLRCDGHRVVVDMCWPDHGLVVEYDGFGPHTERATFERDRRRWTWLRSAGLELRAYTAESLRERPTEVGAEVLSLLR